MINYQIFPPIPLLFRLMPSPMLFTLVMTPMLFISPMPFYCVMSLLLPMLFILLLLLDMKMLFVMPPPMPSLLLLPIIILPQRGFPCKAGEHIRHSVHLCCRNRCLHLCPYLKCSPSSQLDVGLHEQLLSLLQQTMDLCLDQIVLQSTSAAAQAALPINIVPAPL